MGSTQPTRRRRHQPGEPVSDLHYYLRQQSRGTLQEMAASVELADAISRLREDLVARAVRWIDGGEYALAAEQLLEVVGLTPEEDRDRPLTLVT